MMTLIRSLTVARLLATSFLALAGLAGAAHAASFSNGTFDTFSGTSDRAVTNSNSGAWRVVNPASGPISVITPALANTSYSSTPFGTITLGHNNTFTAAPGGGTTQNFLAMENISNACGCYIYQTITGLVVNASYSVGFYQAGAVWSGSTLATTEFWKVGWGTTTTTSIASQTNSSTINTPVLGFSGWIPQQMQFVATATQMVLSFMANGSPTGQPPFALLDGVTLTQVQSPEPASAALIISGLIGLIGMRRAARRRASA